MKPYYGITYPMAGLLCTRPALWLWRKFCCKRRWHLWDECCSYFTADDGGHEHFLVCDACQLMVWIEKIDTEYVALKETNGKEDTK